MTADPDVLGYISQCGICPQKALTRTAHPAGTFICERCREVTGWGDVDVAQAEPTGRPLVNATEDGDEPIGEAPELTMPRAVSLIDRQAQALNEIRGFATHWSFSTVSKEVLAILARLGF